MECESLCCLLCLLFFVDDISIKQGKNRDANYGNYGDVHFLPSRFASNMQTTKSITPTIVAALFPSLYKPIARLATPRLEPQDWNKNP
jgi:hypothetical protein